MRKSGLVVVLVGLGQVAAAEPLDPPRQRTPFEALPVTVGFTFGSDLGAALGFRVGYSPPGAPVASFEAYAALGGQETAGLDAYLRPLAGLTRHSPLVRLGVSRTFFPNFAGGSWSENHEVVFGGWEVRLREGFVARLEGGALFRQGIPSNDWSVIPSEPRITPAFNLTVGFGL